METAIIGAGAMGMLLAHRMAEAGLRPTLVARTERQKLNIEENGLRLGQNGESAVYLSCMSIEEWKTEDLSRWDWVLCTVKQTHLDALLHMIRHAKGLSNTNWLFMQNGLGHAEKAAEWIDPARIFCGVTTEAARKLDERTVLHTGKGHTWIGRPLQINMQDEAAAEQAQINLCKQLILAGFRWSVSKNIHRYIWEKLLVNAVINPLTGITGVPNGGLLESPDLIVLMRLLFQEGAAVAKAEQAEISPDLWEKLLSVCKQTANNRSSMLQDIDGGRTTEVEWINGSIIRRAETHGIPVPTHLTVYHLIKSISS